MISKPLFKQDLKSNYKILLIFMGVVAMYSVIMVSMFSMFSGENSVLTEMIRQMPEIAKAFGFDVSATVLTGYLASYLYGMILLMFPMIYTIILSNRLVARHVDKGSMAYLLATPNTRKKIVITQALFSALSLFVLVLFATVLLIIASAISYPGELEIGSFLLLNLGLYFLHLAIAGICFFASCISNESKTALGISAAAAIGFYLLQMIANMGGNFEWLKYLTLFTLFQASEIAGGSVSAFFPSLILFGVGIAFYVAGISVFTKRDLSL